jgi:DNA invertase Pin-like site-specific DNA recombinase
MKNEQNLESAGPLYIGYMRVSTKKQDLGLDVQYEALKELSPVQIYQDTISGKKDEREGLIEAIEHCKRINGILLFYKLDRLSRSVSMIFQLRDSGIPLQCITMPDLNTITIGMLATWAQHEREQISSRTKEALQRLKASGVKLGVHTHKKPLTKEHYSKIGKQSGVVKRKQTCKAMQMAIKLSKDFRQQGMTYHDIAEKLNNYDLTTRKGKAFHKVTVRRLCMMTLTK